MSDNKAKTSRIDLSKCDLVVVYSDDKNLNLGTIAALCGHKTVVKLSVGSKLELMSDEDLKNRGLKRI